MSLSDRVWRYTDQFKTEIEMGIDCGLRDGLDAAQMARRLKQYLQHPDKLFRRVRDEHGNLQLSKAAAAFHPGRGVYRSSYKNARRLAATETNMAYRTADHERWQQLDFIVGIEIHLSNNHTCLDRKGKPKPFYDICDELKGKYPKDFKFTGWHPHCRCIATTILKTEAEMEADDEAILRRKKPSDPDESENAVTELPDNFTRWVEENQDRIARAKSLPYFISDNVGVMMREAAANSRGIGSNVPAGLNSQEQRAWVKNEHDIADNLGITQGKPMTHDEANEKNPNPNYVAGEENGYNNNCQSCVVAYEMRRRGYDVEALMRINNDQTNMPDKLSKRTQSAWIDQKTGEEPQKRRCGGAYDIDRLGRVKYKSLKQINKELDEATSEPGRYHIDWAWNNKEEGHIIVAERFENGGIRFYDPQTGKVKQWKDIASRIKVNNGVGVLRVDDLLLNENVACNVVRRKTHHPHTSS